MLLETFLRNGSNALPAVRISLADSVGEGACLGLHGATLELSPAPRMVDRLAQQFPQLSLGAEFQFRCQVHGFQAAIALAIVVPDSFGLVPDAQDLLDRRGQRQRLPRCIDLDKRTNHRSPPFLLMLRSRRGLLPWWLPAELHTAGASGYIGLGQSNNVRSNHRYHRRGRERPGNGLLSLTPLVRLSGRV